MFRHMRHWWGVLPLNTNWLRKRYDSPTLIAKEGPFIGEKHLPLASQRLSDLVYHFMEELQCTTLESLLSCICENQLHTLQGAFTTEEQQIISELNNFQGDPTKLSYSPITPSCMAELAHWATFMKVESFIRIRGASAILSNDRVALPYVDAHFHMNRLCDQIKYTGDLYELVEYEPDVQGKYLAAAITNVIDASDILEGQWKQYLKDPMLIGTIGIHPKQANKLDKTIREAILGAVDDPKIRAIGETGLDFTVKRHLWAKQQEVFIELMLLSNSRGLPIVIHSRDSDRETLDLLKRYMPPKKHIHWHCFRGPVAIAKEFTKFFPNAVLGVTASITNNKHQIGQMGDVIRITPISQLIGETDSPYFPPVNKGDHQHRTVSYPTDVRRVIDTIATLKLANLETTYKAIRKNVERIYGI